MRAGAANLVVDTPFHRKFRAYNKVDAGGGCTPTTATTATPAGEQAAAACPPAFTSALGGFINGSGLRHLSGSAKKCREACTRMRECRAYHHDGRNDCGLKAAKANSTNLLVGKPFHRKYQAYNKVGAPAVCVPNAATNRTAAATACAGGALFGFQLPLSNKTGVARLGSSSADGATACARLCLRYSVCAGFSHTNQTRLNCRLYASPTASAAEAAGFDFYPRLPASLPGTRCRKPPIFIFMADDLPNDALGSTGNDHVMTPNLDRFADDAHVFTRMFVIFHRAGSGGSALPASAPPAMFAESQLRPAYSQSLQICSGCTTHTHLRYAAIAMCAPSRIAFFTGQCDSYRRLDRDLMTFLCDGARLIPPACAGGGR